MDLNNLPQNVKDKIVVMLSGEEDSKAAVVEEQNRFVERFIESNEIRVRYDGSIQWREQPGISKKILMTKVFEAYKVWAVKRKIASVNRISKGDLTAQFEAFIHQQKVDILLQLNSKLCYNKQWDDDLKELNRFVAALLPEADEKTLRFASVVFQSFIWQVKRKIAGLKVYNQIMPVLFSSKHGTGKSTSVERFTSPLEEFRLDMQLHIFSDPFMRKAFGENFIVVFDEMQGAEKTDVEAMKNAITASTLSARGMRTQDVDTIPQNCTFIGTSNRRVADMIFDATGMRRFVEIELTSMFDLDIIMEKIDYVQVWRSVKEDQENPLKEIQADLIEHQESLRTKSTYEQWMEHYEIEGGEKEQSIKVLYNHYKNWIQDQGKTPGLMSRFGRELSALGVPNLGRKLVKGKRETYYGLNIDLGTGLK